MLSEIDGFLVPALETLREEGLLDETLVILTSDHGDNLYEKAGSYSHSQVYETIAHVPLLLHVPGDTQGSSVERVGEPGRLRTHDLRIHGRSRSRAALWREPARPERARRGSRARNLRAGRISGRRPRAGNADARRQAHRDPDGSLELYQLASDPSEQRDLAAAEPERVARLARQLDAVFAAAQNDSAADRRRHITPDVVEKLRGARLHRVGCARPSLPEPRLT